MKHRVIVSVIFLLLSVPSVALAQTPVTQDTIRPFGIRQAEEVREAVQKRLEQVRQNREEAVERVHTRREAMQEQIDDRKTEFRAQLAALQDGRKKNIIENIDVMLQNKNEQWTNHANAILSRLSQIVVKISTRADLYAKENDVDVALVMKAIAEAQAAIDTAQASVTEQSGRSYFIDLSDESTVGENTRAAIQQLKTDIETMMDAVREARTEVQQALRALQLLNSNAEE